MIMSFVLILRWTATLASKFPVITAERGLRMAVTGGSSPAVDVYDEEFHMNLKLAKNLIGQLKNGHGN